MGAAIVVGPTSVKNPKIKEAAAKALGNTCDYNSEPGAWDECNVPRGSEGSLQYSVSPNSDDDDHALSWGYASIRGDLRDFGMEELPTISDWFERSLKRLQKPEGFGNPEKMDTYEGLEYILSTFIIRQAVLSVDVESGPGIILLWNDEERAVVKLMSIGEGLEWKQVAKIV